MLTRSYLYFLHIFSLILSIYPCRFLFLQLNLKHPDLLYCTLLHYYRRTQIVTTTTVLTTTTTLSITTTNELDPSYWCYTSVLSFSFARLCKAILYCLCSSSSSSFHFLSLFNCNLFPHCRLNIFYPLFVYLFSSHNFSHAFVVFSCFVHPFLSYYFSFRCSSSLAIRLYSSYSYYYY